MSYEDALPEVTLRLDAPNVEGWTVLHCRAREALSRLDEVSLVVASRAPTAAPDELFHVAATVTLARGHLRRRFRGVVRRVEDLGATGPYRLARLELAPSLWTLSLRRDSRIFQHVNVPAIVQEVLRDAGLYQGDGGFAVPPELQALPPREYCVQYRESDLAFVARLLEDEGVAYYLSRESEGETLTLVDESPSWAAVPTLDGADVPVLDGGGWTAGVESVRAFDLRRDVVSSSVTLRDHDFTHPGAVLDMTPRHPAAPGDLPVYDYPAGFSLGAYDHDLAAYGAHHGARAARVRHQAAQARARTHRGEGNCVGFAAGRAFTLRGHARHELDDRYVLTAVEHVATAWSDIPDDLRGSERLRAVVGDAPPGERAHDRYENRFECLALTVPFRPEREAPRPVIAGAQTAFVVAPAGHDEEVATDPHGRVLVRFHWERPELRTPTQRGRDSSCWVRVAQSWAGAGWGTMFIPRVGMEVVVHFLEGDPDRPLVTGCVYNGESRPPLALPEEKTRSVIKTSSSRGGRGFNELRFDDAAGREQVFVHAQRDHDTVVRRDQSLAVGGDRVKTVEGSEHVTVQRDRVTGVEHHDALDVGGNHTVAVHGSSGASLRVDAAYVLQAHESITLSVGGTSLVLTPDRATLTSRAVHVLGGELVNVYGGLTQINCEDGNRDFIRARAPRAARAVGLQGEPGGSLRRTLVALEPAALVRFARAAVDGAMARAGAPERLRERLGGAVQGAMEQWFQGLCEGRVPDWAKAVERQVAGLVGQSVDAMLSRVLPTNGLGGALGDRVLHGLAQQVRGALTEAATSGVMHAMALDRGASQDPFWHALQQRDGEGVRGALRSFAQEAAGQSLARYAARHAGDGARDALVSWLRPGVEGVISEVGASLLPQASALH